MSLQIVGVVNTKNQLSADVNALEITVNAINSDYVTNGQLEYYIPKAGQKFAGRGFADPTNTTVTYDPATLKITYGGALYWDFDAVELVTYTSEARTNTNGSWFLYYKDTGYTWANSMWAFTDAPIAYGFVGASAEIWLRECHGRDRNPAWHQGQHQSQGTYRTSGGGFVAGSYTLGSSTATNRRPQIPQTVIWDEDVPSILSALTTNAYSHLYLTSTNTANITVDNSEIMPQNGALPRYNAFSAGSWSLADVPNLNYAKYFVIAVPVTGDATNQKKRYLFQMAQTTSLNLSTIQAVSPSDMNWGELQGVLPEFDYIGEIIVRVQAGNWTLTSLSIIDGTRVTQTGGGSGFLSSVVTDASTILGDGTATTPLYVNPDLTLTTLTTTGSSTLGDGSGDTQTLRGNVTMPDATSSSTALQFATYGKWWGVSGGTQTDGAITSIGVNLIQRADTSNGGYVGLYNSSNQLRGRCGFPSTSPHFNVGSTSGGNNLHLTVAGSGSIVLGRNDSFDGTLDATYLTVDSTALTASVPIVSPMYSATFPTASSGTVSVTGKSVLFINGNTTITGGVKGQILHLVDESTSVDYTVTWPWKSGTNQTFTVGILKGETLICYADGYWKLVS
jgi:hypothetical protein